LLDLSVNTVFSLLATNHRAPLDNQRIAGRRSDEANPRTSFDKLRMKVQGISWIFSVRLNFLRRSPVARCDWLGDSMKIDVLQSNGFGCRTLRGKKS
jgi:hypothetical protein